MPEHQQTQQSTESKSTFQKQATPRIQAPISHPMAIIQRARMDPKSLTHADVMQLQSTIGNRAVVRLLTEIGAIPSKAKQAPPVQRQELVQRQEIPEEEEPLQGKFIETIQRQEIPEEEEPLQGKFENKPEIACPSCFAVPIVQRQEIPEEESLQTKRENNTGMPDNLKAVVESLSGIDLSDVRVHYNSSKPADVVALAYTQGTNIHVAPGQERHLPHEAWHVVQQAQGRVRPTFQMKDMLINDDAGLEQEADVIGEKALQMTRKENVSKSSTSRTSKSLQRRKRAVSPFPVPQLQAQPEPVQRYGVLGIGVPGVHNVAVGTFLIHGTGAQQFRDTHGTMQPAPDAPAWFAIESRFSAHAGSRGGGATTYVHNYQVNAALALLAFNDVADLSQYLQNNMYAAADENGVTQANQILALNPGIHGYWLERDAVRNEEEIILFNAGIANLAASFRSELQNVEQPRFGDESDIGRKRRLIQGGQTIHVGNMMDLSDFRTTADDPTTGRRRSQSFR